MSSTSFKPSNTQFSPIARLENENSITKTLSRFVLGNASTSLININRACEFNVYWTSAYIFHFNVVKAFSVSFIDCVISFILSLSLFRDIVEGKYRNSHTEEFSKKEFLEISENSQENTCARASFLIKAQVFSCEFCEISKNTFL